jgi:EEF1A N-terminal glycine/lysine methyltransferase
MIKFMAGGYDDKDIVSGNQNTNSSKNVEQPTALSQTPALADANATPKFDLLILSDLLFNHSEHAKLVASIKTFLRPPSRLEEGEEDRDYPRALVFFTPHRPWLLEKDEAFFELARAEGFVVQKVFETVLEKPMFADDPGDEVLRRSVFGWEVCWP